MILATFKHFKDYELLDTGEGYRLERWGKIILARPDPQAIWLRHLPENDWEQAHATYLTASGNEKGKWEVRAPLTHPWIIEFNEIKFLLQLSSFKHTGIFAEQAAQWEWMLEKLQKGPEKSEPKILNLFAYTGGATMVLAKTGCFVTHVDASKPAITWANNNQALNKISKDKIRWILDDAAKFAKRELNRGAQYDGIIMDPPAFGHSPSGKVWKFNQDLPQLLKDCVALLSPDAKFLVINGYATNSSALALHNILEDTLNGRAGTVESGELCLQQKDKRIISTGIFARWQK